MLVLFYPKCGTCRKALKWLEEHQIAADLRNIVENNPKEDELKGWIEKSGLSVAKFFNTYGLLYKERNLKEVVKAASTEELIRVLSENGMLVKRPLVIADDFVLVGFKEDEWSSRLL